MKQSFTPAMYELISKRAFELCNEANITDEKGVKRMFDKAIKEAGYTPAYVNRVMRDLYPEN